MSPWIHPSIPPVNLWLLEFNEIDDDDDQLSVLHRHTYTCRWSANHASVMEWNEKVRWNKTIIPKCEPVCCQSWPFIHMMILGRLGVWATSNPEAKLGSGCRQSVSSISPSFLRLVLVPNFTLLYFLTTSWPVFNGPRVRGWGSRVIGMWPIPQIAPPHFTGEGLQTLQIARFTLGHTVYPL